MCIKIKQPALTKTKKYLFKAAIPAISSIIPQALETVFMFPLHYLVN